jgi:flavorubredoxin
VGNKQYTEKAQTDVVGDLDIEIKLNKSGAFRLNLFSHSADSYTNYLDNSQRNGVGLTYQTEFSSLKQFFKNLFSSKKKRQEAKQAEEEARAKEERVTLKIE